MFMLFNILEILKLYFHLRLLFDAHLKSGKAYGEGFLSSIGISRDTCNLPVTALRLNMTS